MWKTDIKLKFCFVKFSKLAGKSNFKCKFVDFFFTSGQFLSRRTRQNCPMPSDGRCFAAPWSVNKINLIYLFLIRQITPRSKLILSKFGTPWSVNKINLICLSLIRHITPPSKLILSKFGTPWSVNKINLIYLFLIGQITTRSKLILSKFGALWSVICK